MFVAVLCRAPSREQCCSCSRPDATLSRLRSDARLRLCLVAPCYCFDSRPRWCCVYASAAAAEDKGCETGLRCESCIYCVHCVCLCELSAMPSIDKEAGGDSCESDGSLTWEDFFGECCLLVNFGIRT